MIAQPPATLTQSERDRLEIVGLPGSDEIEAVAVYRFSDTLEYIAEDDETESAIKEAFPGAKIRRA
jgi:hypothetical protein